MPCRKLPGQARYRHHLVESDDAAIPGTFDLKVPFPRVPAIDGSEIRRRLAPPDYISSAFVHFRRQRRSPLQATDEIYTQAFRHLPLVFCPRSSARQLHSSARKYVHAP